VIPYYTDDYVTLYHGDCRELLPSIEADVVVTDPPYGIGTHGMRLGNRVGTPLLRFDDVAPDIEPLLAWPCIIWGGNYFPLPVSRAWLVWNKRRGLSFAEAELAWTNLDQPVRAITVDENGGTMHDRSHPTQKPLRVMVWCLGFTSGTVLDPFAGSGSTLVAAKSLNRKAIGIEIEERYCEVAANRLRQEVLGLAG